MGSGDDGPFAYYAHEWVGVSFLSLVGLGFLGSIGLTVAEVVAER